MTSKARELCRLPFRSVDIAVRHTALVNAVLAMSQPILDGYRLKQVSAHLLNAPGMRTRIDDAWRSVRAEIEEAIRVHEVNLAAMKAPKNALDALRGDTANYSANALKQWMLALDDENISGGPAASLGNMLSHAESVARPGAFRFGEIDDLRSAAPFPNRDQLLSGERAGTIYWMNVDGQDLVVLEHRPLTTSSATPTSPSKESA